MKEPAEYRYDVFVSYRHKDVDRGWAKWLVESLETFKVPAGLIAKGAKAGIDRVFRDEDELPTSANLGENIEKALLASRYLIVICSKDTPESKWVNEEVKTFREWGRHDRILALLVDGEPSESFPQALGEIRETTTHDNGTTTGANAEVEPLADVRPRADEAPKLQKQKALLRIGHAHWGQLRRLMAAPRQAPQTAATNQTCRHRRRGLSAGGRCAYIVGIEEQRRIAVRAKAIAEEERNRANETLKPWSVSTSQCASSLQRWQPEQALALSRAAASLEGEQVRSEWQMGENLVLRQNVRWNRVLQGHRGAVFSAEFSSEGKRWSLLRGINRKSGTCKLLSVC